MVQGVSQQPEILRLNSQATSQVNGFSSVVEGLKKRPPTNYLATISTSALNNAYIHTINRDVNERYIVIITNGAIQVKTIAGATKSVVMQTNASNYLSSSDPRGDFVAVTVEGPSTVKFIFFTPLKSNFTLIPLTFKIISVRSSLTPGIEENS